MLLNELSGMWTNGVMTLSKNQKEKMQNANPRFFFLTKSIYGREKHILFISIFNARNNKEKTNVDVMLISFNS